MFVLAILVIALIPRLEGQVSTTAFSRNHHHFHQCIAAEGGRAAGRKGLLWILEFPGVPCPML